MPLADPLITETTDRIFTSLCTPALVNDAENGQWPAPLWAALTQAGLEKTWVPQSLGGAGASVADGFAVARIAGRHAAPVPIADTLAANRLLSAAQLQVPDGMAGLCTEQGDTSLQIDAAGVLSGTAARVPFGRSVGRSCSGLPSQR